MIPDAVALARRTRQTIHRNLIWSFGYNLAAVPIAAAGLLNPLVAAATMSLSSLFVTYNSLRDFGTDPRLAASREVGEDLLPDRVEDPPHPHAGSWPTYPPSRHLAVRRCIRGPGDRRLPCPVRISGPEHREHRTALGRGLVSLINRHQRPITGGS